MACGSGRRKAGGWALNTKTADKKNLVGVHITSHSRVTVRMQMYVQSDTLTYTYVLRMHCIVLNVHVYQVLISIREIVLTRKRWLTFLAILFFCALFILSVSDADIEQVGGLVDAVEEQKARYSH